MPSEVLEQRRIVRHLPGGRPWWSCPWSLRAFAKAGRLSGCPRFLRDETRKQKKWSKRDIPLCLGFEWVGMSWNLTEVEDPKFAAL